MITLIDNILSEQMLHFCYNSMIGMPIWRLDMQSHPDSEYNIVGNTLFDKHMNIGDKGKVQLLATMIYILKKEKATFL